jgi:hypothetical protein
MTMKLPSILLLLSSLLEVQGKPIEDTVSYTGLKIPFGDGLIWSYVTLEDEDSNEGPYEVGIKFTGSFASLPTTVSDGWWDIRNTSGSTVIPVGGHEYPLFFPTFQGKVDENILLKHAVVNWNPRGHDPDGVYNVPHLDFHFYLIESDLRSSCAYPVLDTERCPREEISMCAATPGPALFPADCESVEFFVAPLPDDMQPKGYDNFCTIEPGMGNHLINFAGPEFDGKDFTHNWIWGTQGGEISFLEPMITRELLESVANGYNNAGWYDDEKAAIYGGNEIEVGDHTRGIEVPIQLKNKDGQDLAMPQKGLYPSKYRVLYDEDEKTWTVSLADFVKLDKSSHKPKGLECPGFISCKKGKKCKSSSKKSGRSKL